MPKTVQCPTVSTIVMEEPEHPVVVSFDPGESTGWSVIQVHRDALDPDLGDGNMAGDCKLLDNILHHSYGTFYSGGFGNGELAVAREMELLCGSWPFAAIVFEDFVLRKLSADRSLLSPVRINSMCQMLLHMKGRTWVLQSAATAKAAVTNDRLTAWGLGVSGITHENDAKRHGMNLLKAAKFDPEFARELWAPLWA